MALRPISRMDDFRFPEQAWDVRGWTVRTEADQEKVGKVDDMLLDGNGELRYLDVDLGLLKKHVLVPLERAHADSVDRTVWIDGMTAAQLEDVPEYALDPTALDESYERRLNAVYGSTTGAPAAAGSDRSPGRGDDDELELRRMSELEKEYRLATDDPRGWKVATGDGRRIGRVAELLMEPAEMRARFMDVVVDEKELGLEPVDRHILLPVDRVRLERSKKVVLVSGLLAHDIGDYPHYGGMPVRGRAVTEIDRLFDRVAGEDRGEEHRDTDRDAQRGDAEAPGIRGERREGAAAPEERSWSDRTLRHFYQSRPRSRQTPVEEE